MQIVIAVKTFAITMVEYERSNHDDSSSISTDGARVKTNTDGGGVEINIEGAELGGDVGSLVGVVGLVLGAHVSGVGKLLGAGLGVHVGEEHSETSVEVQSRVLASHSRLPQQEYVFSSHCSQAPESKSAG